MKINKERVHFLIYGFKFFYCRAWTIWMTKGITSSEVVMKIELVSAAIDRRLNLG